MKRKRTHTTITDDMLPTGSPEENGTGHQQTTPPSPARRKEKAAPSAPKVVVTGARVLIDTAQLSGGFISSPQTITSTVGFASEDGTPLPEFDLGDALRRAVDAAVAHLETIQRDA